MHSTHESVVSAVVEALAAGYPVWLATVIQTWGSSPRPAGSLMCWSELTGVVGSISGGCIEEDVLAKIKAKQLLRNQPELLSYGGDDAERFQLPCGGELKICVEYISNDSEQAAWCDLLKALSARNNGTRTLDLSSGYWSWLPAPASGSRQVGCAIEGSILSNHLGPARKLLIIGAGPTTEYLVEFAQSLDYLITVCDPSSDVAPRCHKRADIEFIAAYPDGFISRDFGDKNCAVVAVSHDPRIDDMALIEVLPTEVFYVGAMGSLRTSQQRRLRLKELGITDVMLQKLHAPIGLDIGSKTPAEIALSICAHLVACQP